MVGRGAGTRPGARPLVHPSESKREVLAATNTLRKNAEAGTMEGRALL
jgi:hypothetical protein